MSDYGQVRAERIAVVRESSHNVLTRPTARDLVLLRGRATLPSVLSERRRSEEIRSTPDIDQTIRAKQPPGEIRLSVYAKVPTAGRLPQWAALALDTFGLETMVLRVLDYAALTGATITVMMGDTSTVLTEGVEWTAATNDAATAASIAAAIDALPGLGATAASHEILITRDAGTGEYSLATSADPGDLQIAEVRYRIVSDILERSLSIWQLADHVLHGWRGCKISRCEVAVSGEDEATITFSGWSGGEVFCGRHRLAVGLSGSASPAIVTLTLSEALALRLGPAATDTAIVQIDAERFRLIPGTVNYDALTVEAERAYDGTTAAAHAVGALVEPVFPEADPDPQDTIVGMTLGRFLVDGIARRVVEASIVKDEGLDPRIDEAFTHTLTGYRRPEARTVSCEFTAYQRESIVPLLTLAERDTTVPLVCVLGDLAEGLAEIEWSLPRYQFARPEIGERGGEYTRTFRGEGLASTHPGNDGIALTVRWA